MMFNGNDLELLSAYLDGALTDEERAALEARLQTDADLRRELARLRATVELIHALPPLTAPRDFTLSRQMARRPVIWLSTAFSAASAAAAVILLVIGGLLLTTSANTAVPAQTLGSIAALPTASTLGTQREVGQNDLLQSGSALSDAAAKETTTAALKAATESATEEALGVLRSSIPATASALPSPQSTTGSAAPAPNVAAAPAVPQAAPSAAPQEQQLQAAEAPAANQSGGAAPPSAQMFAAPTMTAAPTLQPTASPAPSRTPSPSATPLPTLTPVAAAPSSTSSTQNLGLGAILIALVLLIVALLTTLIRRRG